MRSVSPLPRLPRITPAGRHDHRLLNGPGVGVDDLIPLTNPSQQMDLARMCFYCPALRRPYMVLAVLDLTQERWAAEAGLEITVARTWLACRSPMPLGAAFRLARVLGLSVEELFEGFVR